MYGFGGLTQTGSLLIKGHCDCIKTSKSTPGGTLNIAEIWGFADCIPRLALEVHGGRGWSRKGQEPVWGRFFSIFSILETPQDRQYNIEIFEIFDTFGIYGLGSRREGYLFNRGAYRRSKISIFPIFPIENIEKIEAHRKKMIDGQDCLNHYKSRGP